MSGFKIYANIDSAVYKATADITGYDQKTKEAIKSAISAGVDAIRDRAIRAAPAGATGNLKAGIKAEMSKYGASGVIKSTSPHSHIVEFGTGPRITMNRLNSHKKALVINGSFVKGMINNGKMPAKPFMRPAVEAEKPKIEESIKKVLQ